jgi:hypothetical protein
MTIITCNDKDLTINVEGIDKLFAFKGHVTIPLKHVEKIEKNTEPLMDFRHAAFGIGTIFANRIQTGSFSEDGEKSFWDVRDPQKAILITLKDEEYSKIIAEVEDPMKTIGEVQTALAKIQLS